MDELFGQIQELKSKIGTLTWQYWWEHTFLSWQWWMLLALMVVPAVLTFRFANRAVAKQLAIVYLLSALICFALDQAGVSLLLWAYPYSLTPLPREVMDPANFFILPFFYAMLYQICEGWRPYLALSFLFAVFASFVGGWLFESTRYYLLLQWNYAYSVPIYFLIALVNKWIADWLHHVEKTEHYSK